MSTTFEYFSKHFNVNDVITFTYNGKMRILLLLKFDANSFEGIEQTDERNYKKFSFSMVVGQITLHGRAIKHYGMDAVAEYLRKEIYKANEETMVALLHAFRNMTCVEDKCFIPKTADITPCVYEVEKVTDCGTISISGVKVKVYKVGDVVTIANNSGTQIKVEVLQ